MCGIAGFWSRERPAYEPGQAITRMIGPLRHRGPDDEGRWSDAQDRLHLGHTRLSVIDLSMEGHQPMVSRSGRFVITYNGEIFNFEDLRSALSPAAWRGHSDTEVMLEAVDRWGVEGAARRFNGQFAFGVWDDHEKALYLVRDRVGIKPVYFGQFNGTLVFGSELKALRAHPEFVDELRSEAIVRFLELGYVPGPLSVYRRVQKLPPGHILRLAHPDANAEPAPFWSLPEIAVARQTDDSAEDETIRDFELLLRDAVRKRLISDVPIGAFLSGGIDSSVIVALMQQEAGSPVKTFSIGFEDEDYDEAPHATRVAKHLGTDHTNLYVAPSRIFELLAEMPGVYDEPFADESQVPTALVSRLARKSVTVCLSGDGGDELFDGYSRYDRVSRHWSRIERLPQFARYVVGALARPTAALERTGAGRHLLAAAARMANRSVSLGQVTRLLDLAGSHDALAFYRGAIGLDARSLAGPRLRDAAKGDREVRLTSDQFGDLTLREAMMLADAMGYLPDDILVKVDRASMDVALEVRVPLLDHRVVERSWSIPESLKLRNGQSKWILREILAKYVPRSHFERPKQGFAVPLHDWLRGPLRDWAESLLSEQEIESDGLLDPAAARSLWREHLESRSNAKTMLWRILSLQSWLRHRESEARTERHAGATA